jgi:hypothetical protein
MYVPLNIGYVEEKLHFTQGDSREFVDMVAGHLSGNPKQDATLEATLLLRKQEKRTICEQEI